MKSTHLYILYGVLALAVVLLFASNILFGSVSIPFDVFADILSGKGAEHEKWGVIITASRFPQAVTALLAGAALAVSGLMLQTLFNNPLADPSILGVSSGAGLGVALVMLLFGINGVHLGLSGYLSVVAGAMVGAMVVLGLLILFSMIVKSNVMLLVVGIMVGYIASSVISLLNFYATESGVVSFVMWGMGDFSGVSNRNLLYFVIFILSGLFISVMLIKPLNALLLGERYSRNLGVSLTRARIIILLVTGLLTAIVTAFCGPVSFIGLAVPHIARLLLGSSNHRQLLPVTVLLGAVVSLLCNLLTVVIGKGTVIPLNVITPLMGAPVIIYVIVNKKKIAYFNEDKMEKVLDASGLALGYKLGRKGTKVVHKGLNLALHAGESVALLGANGSGKSTLIKTLCGFIPSLAGTVLLLGKPLAQYSKRELSRLIGVVLTERVADGGLTVWDLVSLGRYPYTGFFGVLQKEDTIAVERAMDIIGIRDMAGRYISQLSDGERQKAMIAKCLAQECPVIILDEPTAFLDVRSRIEITDILHRLAMEERKSILMSTHDFELALQLSDTLWIFPKDREFVSGTPEDLIFSGEMDAVFGTGTNVFFDRNTGAFRAKSGGGTDILTEGSGTELFWLKNALRRNGFCPVEESPRPFGKVVIESGIITFHRREYTIKVASFGALLDLLRELRKETVETERR